jgi:hypothetical protein
MALFTTALDLYGGVLWSGELQGFIIHQMVPTQAQARPTVAHGPHSGRGHRQAQAQAQRATAQPLYAYGIWE